MKVYNFGSLNIDYVYDVDHIVKPGETLSSLGYSKHIGGKGLNQSISLSKAGLSVVHIGCIGHDGHFLVDKLNEEAVDTQYIKVTDKPSGHALIQLDNQGNNGIIIHAGANHEMDLAYIDDIFAVIGPEDVIVLQNEVSNIAYIIDQAFAKNVTVAMNLSPVTAEIMQIDLSKITYLLINEIEGEALARVQEPDAIGNHLIQKHPKLNVVLTLGAQGAIYFSQAETLKQAAFSSSAVDTTGAGDTFTGYFLAAVLNGRSIQEALKLGCYASSLAITIKGSANSIPRLDDVITHFYE